MRRRAREVEWSDLLRAAQYSYSPSLPSKSGPMETLKKRSDFLRVAKCRRIVTPGMVVQMAPRPDGHKSSDETRAAGAVRVGYTATKKVGNAVVRHRARRRLRAVARQTLAKNGKPGHDYVLIARANTPRRPFECLLDDLEQALIKLDAPPWRQRVSRKSHNASGDKRHS